MPTSQQRASPLLFGVWHATHSAVSLLWFPAAGAGQVLQPMRRDGGGLDGATRGWAHAVDRTWRCAQAGHRTLCRSGRVDCVRRAGRPGGRPRGHAPLFRGAAGNAITVGVVPLGLLMNLGPDAATVARLRGLVSRAARSAGRRSSMRTCVRRRGFESRRSCLSLYAVALERESAVS